VRNYGSAVAWGIVGFGMGVAATVTNMTAFQRRAATTVVPPGWDAFVDRHGNLILERKD